MITKIPHVQGNELRLAIPLQLETVTLENGKPKVTCSDFIPNPNFPVTVVLAKGTASIEINAVMEGNVAVAIEPGTITEGRYSLTVLCHDDQGRAMRHKRRAAVEVYDVTADAGLPEGIEFNSEAHILDATIFLFAKGDKGDGIAGISVVESDEDDGYNVITITLTTGETVTFNVKNGSKGYGISPETQQAILEGLERIKGLPVHRFLSESEYEALVNADQVDPDTIYLTYEDE